MRNDSILILKGHEILSLLEGQEGALMHTVGAAYTAHALGQSSLPHSVFLHFPEEPGNRIIALPAYLGDSVDMAGVKWVSSFPGNTERGLDRASAVIILNSAQTGRPTAIMEGSIISAKRTAASAALAASHLHAGRPAKRLGLIGCGLINFEVKTFLRAVYPELETMVLYDHSPQRAAAFKRKCRSVWRDVSVEIAGSPEELLSTCSLISLATTASEPHIMNLDQCAPGSTLLHVSLRDLSPEAILASDNVVDDIDHVCRARTSVHLAEQLTGNRDFVRCTLADILDGRAPARRDPESIAVFSPFGLGVLDLAVAKLVFGLGLEHRSGSSIESFLPASWLDR